MQKNYNDGFNAVGILYRGQCSVEMYNKMRYTLVRNFELK